MTEKKNGSSKWHVLGILFAIALILSTIFFGSTGFLTVLIIAIYFLPSLQALYNNKKQTESIFVLNLLLGWTLIGWVICLVWACMKD